jgi:hypothetical protein
MAKIFQVRYTVGDKTVAHEHYTEKGGRSDAKALSKVIGNAMMGEIDVADDNTQSMVRIWEFTGGEMGKPIKREGAPSAVEVVKTADDTRIAEGKVEKKPKTPKLTDEEKIAKIKAEAEQKLKEIAEGTFVLPARGRKATGEPKAPRAKADAADRVAKLVEDLKISEKAAKIISGAQLNATGRRMRVVLAIINAEGPINASKIVTDLNATGKEDREVDADDVMGAVHHANFLFSRENQPWRITVKDLENSDKKLNLVAVRIEYDEADEPAPEAQPKDEGEAAA